MTRDLLFSLAIVSALAACKVSGDYGNTRFRCEPGDTCPSGYECMAGFCEFAGQSVDAAPGGDGQFSSDARVIDGPTPEELCGTLGVLSEDFSSNTIDSSTWDTWASGPLSIEHEDGQLVLSVPPNVNQIGGGYYSVARRHLMQNSRASIEIVELDPEALLELSFELKDLDEDKVVMSQLENTLSFITIIGGDELEIGSVPFDPAIHRFWQLREQGGMIFFETSSDGMTWSSHATHTSDPFLGYGEMQVSYWVAAPRNTVGRIALDNFNGGMPSGEPWCPTASITDDFANLGNSLIWNIQGGPGCMPITVDGVLTVNIGNTGDFIDCGLVSRTRLDASASSITVEVPQIADNVEPALALSLANGDAIEIFYSAGELLFGKGVGDKFSIVGSVAYDPAVHRWWRIRGVGGTVHWETSPDGVEFTTFVSQNNPPFRLDEVEAVLWFYVPSAEGQSRSVAFDNFNLAP